MSPSPRHRLNIFIERDHARRLDELAAMKGLSKSSIIAAALSSFLSPDSGDQREAAIAKRLDRLSRQIDKLERDQNILIETVALYVRYFLTVSTPVPEAHQEAARAQGRARFEQFIEQLGRHLLRGRSLVKDVYEEIQPDDGQFFGPGDSTGAATGDDRPATPAGSTPEAAS
ncbi:MAG: CopG family transcriptional regulator [Rubrivivax sp.]